jgi:CBS domain containing-hemolysin-like protein
MDSKLVKDIMVPLDDYAVVSDTATLLDAVIALEKAQSRLPVGRDPFRAVLVVNSQGRVVGKVGQWSVLKALEPKYQLLGDDVHKLAVAGVSDQFLASTMEHFRFFKDKLSDLCMGAYDRRVTDVMNPVTEYIDENAGLCDAIHVLVMRQTLSVLVKRKDTVVGLLRLSDLFQEVTRHMKEQAAEADRSQEK